MSIGTCAVVEPRNHKALRFVVCNVRKTIPNWPIFVFHGTENKQWVIDLLHDIENIYFFELNVENLSIAQYNQVLTSAIFYETFQTEYVLIFQTDVMLFPHSGQVIEDFLGYDYIGANWLWNPSKNGNGGLSLRRIAAMLEHIHNNPYSLDNCINEDVYFSNAPFKFPNYELAQRFSVESVYYPTPFGIHKAWSHLEPHEFPDYCSAILDLVDKQCLVE